MHMHLKVTISQIAKEAGVSDTTVVRALRDLPGISFETKKYIIDIANKMGYTNKKVQRKPDGKLEVCILIPNTPVFFWGQALKGVIDGIDKDEKFSYKVIYYSNIMNREDVANCLLNAIQLDADAYIVVPCHDVKVESLLKILTAQKPVFLLAEWVDVNAVAYVGADYERDGRMLAKAWKKYFSQNNRFVGIHASPENYMVYLRNQAFYKELEQSKATYKIVGKINNISTEHSKLSSAIARELHKFWQKEEFDCVYISQGFIPQACNAVQKLKLKKNIICIGYEYNNNNEKYRKDDVLKIVLSQDIYGQGKMCVEKLQEYMENKELQDKFFFVSSKIAIHS